MSRLLALASALALLGACESPLSSLDHQRLDLAQERWDRRGFANYAFEMRRSCFCPPDMTEWARVEVSGGAVQRVVLLSSGTVITDFRRDWWPTVDGLFQSIRDADRSDWVEDIEVEFDATLGFPIEIHWIPESGILDAGGTDFLRNVGPLP